MSRRQLSLGPLLRRLEPERLHRVQQVRLGQRFRQRSSKDPLCERALVPAVCTHSHDRRSRVLVLGAFDVPCGHFSVHARHLVVHQYAVEFCKPRQPGINTHASNSLMSPSATLIASEPSPTTTQRQPMRVNSVSSTLLEIGLSSAISTTKPRSDCGIGAIGTGGGGGGGGASGGLGTTLAGRDCTGEIALGSPVHCSPGTPA